MRILLIPLFAALTLLFADVASAKPSASLERDADGRVIERVVVGGRQLALPVPPGFCAVDRHLGVGRAIFDSLAELMAPENVLLAYWMDCGDYKALINHGEEPQRYVMVFTPASELGGTKVVPTDRGRYIDALVRARDDPAARDETQQRLEQLLGELAANDAIDEETRRALRNGDYLAMAERYFKTAFEQSARQTGWGTVDLGHDATAVYIGTVRPIEPRLAGVSAGTLLQRIPIWFAAYDSLETVGVYERLRNETRAIVQAAIALNEGEDARTAGANAMRQQLAYAEQAAGSRQGRQGALWRSLAIGTVLAALLGVALFFIAWRRRRAIG